MSIRKLLLCGTVSCLLLILLSVTGVCAEEFIYATAESFEVAPTFYDNMVFQQNEEIKIWGTSSCEGEYMNARLGDSFAFARIEDGKWEITFAPRVYSPEALALEIYGGPGSECISFENIHIGDVWWVVGQSNVEFASSTSSAWNEFLQSLTGEEKIFIYDINSSVTEETNHDRWRKMNKYSSASSSALACFTSKKMCDALQNEIPLGIVIMGYSGAELSRFMPEELTKDVPFASMKNDIYEEIIIHHEKMPIKGMIWYQGEADEPVYSVYAKKLSSFIELLRNSKNQANRDFPVYAVELPPCFDDANDPCRQFMKFGSVRGETGVLCADIKNFHICPTSDLWKDRAFSNNLHPDNKMQVANRLHLMLLSKEYGYGESAPYFAPQLTEYSITDDEKCVTLKFSQEIMSENLSGFLVIGSEWADLKDSSIIELNGNTITVKNDAAIKMVRYNTETSNVFGEDIFMSGTNGLPVPAFSVTFENMDPPPIKPINPVWFWILSHKKLTLASLIGVSGIVWFVLRRIKRKKRSKANN